MGFLRGSITLRTLRYAALLVSEVRPGICGEAPGANGGVVGIAAVVFSEVFLPEAPRHETVSGRRKKKKKTVTQTDRCTSCQMQLARWKSTSRTNFFRGWQILGWSCTAPVAEACLSTAAINGLVPENSVIGVTLLIREHSLTGSRMLLFHEPGPGYSVNSMTNDSRLLHQANTWPRWSIPAMTITRAMSQVVFFRTVVKSYQRAFR